MLFMEGVNSLYYWKFRHNKIKTNSKQLLIVC